MRIEKILDIERVYSILALSGSRAYDGIDVEFKSGITFFFERSKLLKSFKVEKEGYDSVKRYISKILNAHANYYGTEQSIEGKYKISGKENDLQTHFIKCYQKPINKEGEKSENVLSFTILFKRY